MQPDPISQEEIEEISKLISEAQDAGDNSTAYAAERVRQCVQIGELLQTAKAKVGHGNWERFAAEKWPDVLKTTRSRWMKLAEAKQAGRLDLESARGLRHAYQLAGLLPDPGEGTNAKGAPKQCSYLVHVARLVASLQGIELEKLSAPEKATLRERLNPVVVLHGRLVA